MFRFKDYRIQIYRLLYPDLQVILPKLHLLVILLKLHFIISKVYIQKILYKRITRKKEPRILNRMFVCQKIKISSCKTGN